MEMADKMRPVVAETKAAMEGTAKAKRLCRNCYHWGYPHPAPLDYEWQGRKPCRNAGKGGCYPVSGTGMYTAPDFGCTDYQPKPGVLPSEAVLRSIRKFDLTDDEARYLRACFAGALAAQQLRQREDQC